MGYEVRKATFDDREAITRLIADSARRLSREHYADAQIEAAIESVFGVDTTLIEDGTYFVAEQDGTLIGCGGWSKRKTLYGGDQFSDRDTAMIDPTTEPSRIRAFFVHPEHARKGVARAILSVCEGEARALSSYFPRCPALSSTRPTATCPWEILSLNFRVVLNSSSFPCVNSCDR
jgi:GNAT superfamily N-acetyltransferase